MTLFICKDCLLVSIFPSILLVGALIHQTGTTMIRYWFVRSSLDVSTQIMMKKGHFVAAAILIPQVRVTEY